jgi:hypothetical protein
MSTFFEKLENVRARPEHQRRQLTFWASAGITGLVAIVWVVSLSFTLRTSSPTSQVASVGVINATSSPEKSSTDDNEASFLKDNKVKIIEGWKVITN